MCGYAGGRIVVGCKAMLLQLDCLTAQMCLMCLPTPVESPAELYWWRED